MEAFEIGGMGKCSYTRYEWKCPEPTWRGSEQYCIFHDPSPEKDIELFKQKLKEKLGEKDYLFMGYCFLGIADFKNIKFEGDADFRGATFQYADFTRATFHKDADFTRATFHKEVSFSEATFHKDADFNLATFQKDVDFLETTFQKNADFWGAVIERNLEFAPNQINELDLRYAQFLFKGHITADLTEARFHRADLENVAFTGRTWPKKIYEEIHMDDEKLTFKELETIYRNLKQSMQHHGDYSKAGDFYYREMECRKEDMRKKKISFNCIKSLGYSLLKCTCGYGEKPERTVFLSVFSVFAFAFVYWVLGCLDYAAENIGHFEGFIYSLYFSFVTFTTLGIGDIKPLTHTGRILICCEAVIGAFLIALFVLVFARKMMR